mmetsp:Transcript_3392/g.7770  ORF Transcript_3392/g.7770 Transcript_3392/m.7770 type:complete len:207 (+) Transcript_3392:1757-2377(+)
MCNIGLGHVDQIDSIVPDATGNNTDSHVGCLVLLLSGCQEVLKLSPETFDLSSSRSIVVVPAISLSIDTIIYPILPLGIVFRCIVLTGRTHIMFIQIKHVVTNKVIVRFVLSSGFLAFCPWKTSLVLEFLIKGSICLVNIIEILHLSLSGSSSAPPAHVEMIFVILLLDQLKDIELVRVLGWIHQCQHGISRNLLLVRSLADLGLS